MVPKCAFGIGEVLCKVWECLVKDWQSQNFLSAHRSKHKYTKSEIWLPRFLPQEDIAFQPLKWYQSVFWALEKCSAKYESAWWKIDRARIFFPAHKSKYKYTIRGIWFSPLAATSVHSISRTKIVPKTAIGIGEVLCKVWECFGKDWQSQNFFPAHRSKYKYTKSEIWFSPLPATRVLSISRT